MKKLQNNFTTIEQSKRLLELGLPADSADCIYYGKGLSPSTLLGYNGNQFLYSEIKESEDYTPCWSVGRLMEIFVICFVPDFIHFNIYADGINFLQQMMDRFETYAENMDFSKLEE